MVQQTENSNCNNEGADCDAAGASQPMTDKLMSVRKKVVETEKGYEFQYSPSDISLLELA